MLIVGAYDRSTPRDRDPTIEVILSGTHIVNYSVNNQLPR